MTPHPQHMVGKVLIVWVCSHPQCMAGNVSSLKYGHAQTHDFGIRDEELGLMTMGRVLGEVETSFSGFGDKETSYKLVQHGIVFDVQLSFRERV